MKFLGIDYGEKNIGLATGDDETRLASPFGILENKDQDFVLGGLKEICLEEEIGKIIIGLPLTMSGEIGPQAGAVNDFISFLKNNFDFPIETEDERLTSAMVDKLMEESGVKERDAVAAMIILQSYLDRQK
jgi:putative Holliday junction resolvase